MGSAGVPENAKQEATRHTKVFREWKGVYTKASRVATPEANFYDLINLMPVGSANLHTIPAPFVCNFQSGTDSIYAGFHANLNNADYLFLFGTSGKIYQYSEAGDVAVVINGSSPLSGAGSRGTQWKNTVVLFIDSSGYYSWNGTTFTKINSANNGAPSAGQDIAVCFGRVWIANGRVLYYSGVDDYGANLNSTIVAYATGQAYAAGVQVVNLLNGNVYVCATPIAASATPPTGTGTGIADDGGTWNFVGFDIWTPANGSSFINLTDSTLQSVVQRLWVSNGYLYIFGTTSVDVISDVYLQNPPPNPPLPNYTKLNINAIRGTDQPLSVFASDRSIMFASRTGAHALNGVEVDRLSDDIDGTWQFLDFTQPISGGAATIFNILCSCFLINQKNDPVFGNRNVLAINFDQKWFFAQFADPQGAFNPIYAQPTKLLIAATFNATPTCYAIVGSSTNQTLVRLFDNYNVSPPSSLMTALWGMEDSTADKQAIRAGFEAIINNVSGGFTCNVLSPNTTVALTTLGSVTPFQWFNNANQPFTWVNNFNQPFTWFSGNFQLFSGSAAGTYQKYVGLQIIGNGGGGPGTWGPVYELNSINLDYMLRARW